MPNYDFRCKECSLKFSRRVGFSEKDKVNCPDCGGKVEQIFTGFLYTKRGKNPESSSGGCSKSSCSGCSGC